MSRERKFHEPYTTSVQIERSLMDLSQDLGIKLTEALTYGVCCIIDWKIEELTDPKLTPEFISKYRDLKERDLKVIENLLKKREGIQKDVNNLEKASKGLKEQLDEANEVIYVWNDIKEVREFIRKVDFVPAIHQRIVPSQDPIEEEAEA